MRVDGVQPLALVTGGEGDLAQAIQCSLGKRGYLVKAPGREEMDVTDARAVQNYCAVLPQIDLAVCVAGITQDKLMLQMGDDDWQSVLGVNLQGAFHTARAVLPRMQRQGQGHLILIGSYAALRAPIGQANYAASKAGLLGFAASLAREYGICNVRVNTVLPGFMETRMTASVSPKAKEASLGEHQLRRFNTPEAVANFIGFLDAELPHTSGQVFNLDSRIHRWT